MSLNRFEEILANLRLTDLPPPAYVDLFHEVRQCISAWNSNMSLVFVPSWMSCLDESMMVWYNKFSPGFMVVPGSLTLLGMIFIPFVVVLVV